MNDSGDKLILRVHWDSEVIAQHVNSQRKTRKNVETNLGLSDTYPKIEFKSAL